MSSQALPRVALALAAFVAASSVARAGWVHPFDLPQAKDAPAALRVVVEIPAGSFTKYEIDHDTGYLFVDRFVSMPVAYPANYGSIPRTLGGDGDPLDALVLTRAPLHPGVLVEARPIGVIRMLDGGEVDDKVLAVPTSKIDPTYDEVQEVADLPAMERQRLEAFFAVYKQIGSKKKIEIKGWGTAAEARAIVQETIDAYRRKAETAPAAE